MLHLHYHAHDEPVRFPLTKYACPYITKHFADVVFDAQNQSRRLLGSLSYYHVNLTQIYRDQADVWELCDRQGPQFLEFYYSFLDNRKTARMRGALNFSERQSCIWVTQFELSPYCRGRRIGLAVLEALSRRYSDTAGLILQAYPKDFEGIPHQETTKTFREGVPFQLAASKMERYFGQIGFRRVTDLTQSGFMVRSHAIQHASARDAGFSPEDLEQAIITPGVENRDLW